MPSLTILRSIQVERTPRVMQMEGLFDVPPSQRSEERWTIDLDLPDDWHVGLIVGPSGSGKSTLAREMFGTHLVQGWEWPERKSVLDGFPAGMSIKEIVALLSSVGFSSPPSWVRPFGVLSNGEQFRVNMARTLAEMPDLAVVDEFTSVVDRTVAQIGSAAIAKTVRRRQQRFIGVSCHYDIIDWMEPDWVYQPHVNELARGCLWQRPPISLEVKRVHRSAWQMFRKHHYLNTELQSNAKCFTALWRDTPVAFVALNVFPHPQARNLMREHRLVTLPDFQGLSIGNRLSEWAGALLRGIGWRYRSITSHPAAIMYRLQSPFWRLAATTPVGMTLASRHGTLTGQRWKNKTITTRCTSAFEYVGPSLDQGVARRVWNGD